MGWQSEKDQLLDTHNGWFVAYLDGDQVALESSLELMLLSLRKQFGVPRRPCEFHEIGGEASRRRLSPRYLEGQEVT